jgi:hypothetical protein
MNGTMKICKYTDMGNVPLKYQNMLIAALVHIGYEVYTEENYICFKIGNDDKIIGASQKPSDAL